MPDIAAGRLRLNFGPVTEADFDALAALREVALRESLGRDVELEALPQSDANRFYQRHGFVKVGEAEFDVFYVWRCQPGAAA